MSDVEDFRTRIRSLFAQEILSPPDAGLQERRGAQTRELLLRTAIDCLNTVGYAGTTFDLLARASRSSRGAVTHHWASKTALISSVIDYIFYKRLEHMLEGMYAVSTSDPLRTAKFWVLLLDNLHLPEYSAYISLSVAARTDPELKAVFVPRAKLYDDMWRNEMISAAGWNEPPEVSQTRIDVALASYEGLLLNEAIWDEPGRQERYKAAIEAVVDEVLGGRMPMPIKRERSATRNSRARRTAHRGRARMKQ